MRRITMISILTCTTHLNNNKDQTHPVAMLLPKAENLPIHQVTAW